MEQLQKSLLDLVIQTSTNLPSDVRRAMARALEGEPPAERSGQAMGVIASNIDMAGECEGPICQDTGWPTFIVKTPVGVNQLKLEQAIREALVKATKLGKLRPNSVDSLTGKNSGDNLGPGTPTIHFHQWDKEAIEVRLLLKGGGARTRTSSTPCRWSCRIWAAPTATSTGCGSV